MDRSKLSRRLVPSGEPRRFVRGASRLGLASLAVAAVLACGEPQERPRDARPAARSEMVKPSDAPLPPTAFTDDAALEPASGGSATEGAARGDRFATRHIGGEDTVASPRFRGAPVDLDVKGADVHDVFRLLADVGKVNIVVADDVSGAVTMRLRRVPWDQALDVIARARGLVYDRDGDVILVRAAGAR